jgi:rhamnosyltransferase
MKRIALIVPTFNGIKDLPRLLGSLEGQELLPDVLIVDSSSTDGTVELARNRVKRITVIPREVFNHGGTRKWIVEINPDYDVYIFMTHDAILSGSHAIEKIIEPFQDSRVGAVCGRQVPHADANILARHARYFNYPAKSQVKSIEDAAELGLKTAFLSNSFAAYRASALKGVGGFPPHVIFGEDMYAAAKMLQKGWKIAYESEAVCQHSHNYSLEEEFKRYFDNGVFHSCDPWIREMLGGAGGEGVRYVISELRFLGWSHLDLWPSSLVRNALKYFGFKLGLYEKYLPVSLKQKLSMNSAFWKS